MGASEGPPLGEISQELVRGWWDAADGGRRQMEGAQQHLRMGLGQGKARQDATFLCLAPVFKEYTRLLTLV